MADIVTLNSALRVDTGIARIRPATPATTNKQPDAPAQPAFRPGTVTDTVSLSEESLRKSAELRNAESGSAEPQHEVNTLPAAQQKEAPAEVKRKTGQEQKEASEEITAEEKKIEERKAAQKKEDREKTEKLELERAEQKIKDRRAEEKRRKEADEERLKDLLNAQSDYVGIFKRNEPRDPVSFGPDRKK